MYVVLPKISENLNILRKPLALRTCAARCLFLYLSTNSVATGVFINAGVSEFWLFYLHHFHVCMYVSMHARIHTCIHTCMRACMHTYIHTYIYILHTYIHTDIRTYYTIPYHTILYHTIRTYIQFPLSVLKYVHLELTHKSVFKLAAPVI